MTIHLHEASNSHVMSNAGSDDYEAPRTQRKALDNPDFRFGHDCRAVRRQRDDRRSQDDVERWQAFGKVRRRSKPAHRIAAVNRSPKFTDASRSCNAKVTVGTAPSWGHNSDTV